MIKSSYTNKRFRVVVGLTLLCGLGFQAQRVTEQGEQQVNKVKVTAPKKLGPSVAYASTTTERPSKGPSLETMASENPVKFFEFLLEQYDQRVRDYTCTFNKKELVCGRMTKEQVIEVHFREEPFSVRFKWIKNQDKCHRALYVEDRWLEDDKQMAVAEPGAIARIFVPYVMRAIHGKDAAKSSRRTIDQFGVGNSIRLVLKYCKMAEKEGVLGFNYKGKGKVDDRETLVFERHLPYNGEGCRWPDRVLVVHVDKDWLVPVLCVAYGDDAKKELLGMYLTTNIDFNVNLPDSVFTKKGMGLEK